MPIDHDRHVCAFINLHKICSFPATTYTAVCSLATTDAFFILRYLFAPILDKDDANTAGGELLTRNAKNVAQSFPTGPKTCPAGNRRSSRNRKYRIIILNPYHCSKSSFLSRT